MANALQEPVIDLLCELVRRRSVTPDDAGCQALMRDRLEPLGFTCETMPFNDVTNLWARRGDAGPVLCFAGHTDVVPPGDETRWSSDPFEPTFRDGQLYARGSADMKSGLAAMVVAVEEFLRNHPQHGGSIAFLITSDEEGRARDGTLKVMEALVERGEHIDWCVLGEPSSQHRLGDIVRIGRRGSLSGMLTVHGIHEIVWDAGNEYFPPTSFQVVDVRAGIGAPNVTPGELTARFNFRYSTEWTHESLRDKVHSVFDHHDIDYELNWHLSGEPFLTQPGKLIDAVQAVVAEQTGADPELSTGGGTSDGRFISPAGVDVVELGPVNASIHKIDEHVSVEDVIALTTMYRRILEKMLL